MKKISKMFGIGIVATGVLFFISSFAMSREFSYQNEPLTVATTTTLLAEEKIIHLATPASLKAIYMTQCVASRSDLRTSLIKLIDETELNAVVIDIKDYTGTVAFDTGLNEVDLVGKQGVGCRVADMKNLLKELQEKNIYRIGRLTVFQDPNFTKVYPELAVKKKSTGEVWRDRKGLAFIDVGAKPAWDYHLSIAKSAYDIGFDEINFDYIRFPSDGNMKDIDFTHTGSTTKKEMLRQFFEYVDQNLANTPIVTSADIFGMTTTNTDDLGIGQILENALLYFDYVAPMVYPSHYPPNFNGWPDPNKVPYEIIKFSMEAAVARAKFLQQEISGATPTSIASTTIPTVQNRITKRVGPNQLRPWLQDFNYPVLYTPEMVRKQIQATYDVGLTSWMLWSPSNRYTKEVLEN